MKCQMCKEDKSALEFGKRQVKCRACVKEYQRQYRTANLTRKKSVRYSATAALLGIDDTAYDLMLLKQNGVCAVCKQPETRRSRNGTLRRLSIDHCHTAVKVRGLLCYRCNFVLGLCKDDETILHGLADYLSVSRSSQEDSVKTHCRDVFLPARLEYDQCL